MTELELSICICGCGNQLEKYDKLGRSRKYIKGHFWNNKTRDKITGLKISNSKIGKSHSNITKIKISKTLTGRIISEQIRKKISESTKGKILSEETKQKISKSKTNEKHPNWKGNDIKYSSLHQWINRHLPQKDLCEFCNKKPPHDCACITRIYNRDFINWARLCSSCHTIHDRKN